MVEFSRFNTTDNIGLNIKTAIEYCKENGEDTLCFEKGVYKIDGKFLESRYFNISNHSSGDRKTCVLLEGFKDFTIDFGGSELIIEDIAVAVALCGCENITLKNFSVYNKVTFAAEGFITESDDSGFTFKVTDENNKVFVNEDRLFAGDPKSVFEPMTRINLWDKDTKKMVQYQLDIILARFNFTDLGNDLFRADYKEGCNIGYVINEGNRMFIQPQERYSCGVFIKESKNIKLVNYTIYNVMGMGVIAQNSENIEIDSMKAIPKGDACHSLNADATHFVHCKGTINIHDSEFMGQLDDALNVHSVYLRIIEKKESSVILKYMHYQTLGIDIVAEGSVLETCDPKSLIPKKRYLVKNVNRISDELIEVFLEGDISDILVGDNMNEVSCACDVLFENNKCFNNRARSVLIANAGKTIIRNNLFESSGRTILFESDGDFWFESGGVGEVIITENTFNNCNYIGARQKSGGVIVVVQRPKTEEGKYFHKKITVNNNNFIDCRVIPAIVNNTEEFEFLNNRFENCSETEAKVDHVKTFKH